MIELLQSLYAHMAWADDVILDGVAAHAGAFEDEQMRKWLHHVVMVERFFLSLFQRSAFDMQWESQPPATAEEMKRIYEEAHANNANYIARLQEAELACTIDFPVAAFRDFHPTIRDAMMQVALHGEHHRAQIATRLRALGATPKMTDYIYWVREVRGRA